MVSKNIEYDKKVRQGVKEIHGLYLFNGTQIAECVKKTKLSKSRVEQAVWYGKGTITTHVVIFCWGLKIPLGQISKCIPKLRKLVESTDKRSYFDKLLEKVLTLYKLDEIIAWLELLLAKHKIESKLGLRNKVGRPKKKQ